MQAAAKPVIARKRARILVVIVNYRTPRLVVECVRSLDRLQRGADSFALEVAIVDNCSGDDSQRVLGGLVRDSSLAVGVRLIQSAWNGGFAYGNNLALRSLAIAPGGLCEATAVDLVWLLNPDSYVPEAGLEAVLDFLDAHPRAGIVGTRILGEAGDVHCSAFRRPTFLSEIEEAFSMGPVSRLLRHHAVPLPPAREPTRVDWVCGASMFVRAGVFKTVGLLDEAYFMYFEETDFCLLAAARGHEVWYVPSFDVVHLLGKSSGVTGPDRTRKRRPRYWFESRRRFFSKNYSRAYLHCANISWLLAYPLGRLWLLLRKRRSGDPPRLWLDFLRYNYLDV